MLEMQKYLMSEGKISYLEEELNIKVKTINNLYLFKYDMINSPMGLPIVQECRGLILDKRDWSVVSLPFKKFFNYGEGHAATLDLSTAVCLDKFDGTAICAYMFENKRYFQTLGMIHAEGGVCDLYGKSFSDLFVEALGSENIDKLHPEYNYVFELMTKYNRIVTRYEYDQIALLSIRNNKTLEEVPIWWEMDKYKYLWEKLPVILPKTYNFTNLGDITNMAKDLPEMQEGYVAVDRSFNRIKIKNPSYVAISHLKSSISDSLSSIVHLILQNEGNEFLAYFPEFTDEFNDIKARIETEKQQLYIIWSKIKDISTQKDFAFEAVKSKFSGILFSMRNKKIKTFEEGLASMQLKKVIELLNLKPKNITAEE